jgi:hypothetical protein
VNKSKLKMISAVRIVGRLKPVTAFTARRTEGKIQKGNGDEMVTTKCIAAVLIWALGTIGTYRAFHKDENPLADFVGALVFWWLVLPVLCAASTWSAGRMYGERFVRWNDRRKRPRQLCAGAEMDSMTDETRSKQTRERRRT